MAAGSRDVPTIVTKPDWIVVALPTILAIRMFSGLLTSIILAVLVIVAFFRKPDGRYRIQPGPFLTLSASCAIIISRPENYIFPTTFILVGTLLTLIVATVDARKIIGSLIDGVGLYLVINVLGATLGIRSPSTRDRISTLTEATGFIRTVFPLAGSINSPSIVAGAYLVAMVFLIRESGVLRRSIRLTCAVTAVYVIIGAGSRVALVVTLILATAALLTPFIGRWVAHAATLISAISAFVLPDFISSIEFAVKPLLTNLAPGRETTEHGISSLQGRDQIWNGSINFWNEHVNDPTTALLGYGESGQATSGAWTTYAHIVSGITRHPETANVHNSFLQQLFDAGILGFGCLLLAVYWTCSRLAKHHVEWGRRGLCATFALAVLLLANTTEATLAPGVFQESFWMLAVIMGVACQGAPKPDDSPDLPSRETSTCGVA